ncbi:hypothetical protein PSTT_12643 [Puccinia striiformis]|uniref:Uncharacterized protein n=1 Tax=Puccinia striiformis TaxID=27350 RepID=A0A2S4UV99_9BASI|nr:hypothetical protein PSTT_12643 [Puccinia striiformis]
MIVDGFRAYDVLLGQPVLIVMSMMLCFLADSPMHAEITNTPVPGASLNPCRMCTLHAPKKADKRSLSYLLQFLEIDSNGSPQPHVERTWEETIEHTYNLYNLFIRKNITAVKAQRIIYGVTDSLNNRFIDGKRKKSSASLKQLILALEEADITELFNPFLKLIGFDGCKDTPAEILHVFLLGLVKYLVRDFVTKIKKHKDKTKVLELIGCLQSFNTNSLNISLLKPHYLVHHSQYFVACILRLSNPHYPHATFQAELKQHIAIFMYHMIKMTAQWINKPKFHILFHLPKSILRFGPASLFSTENFESFNGVLRKSSTHSNKQAPGRDIAINFSNQSATRFLLSGGVKYNKTNKSTSKCSPRLLALFSNNPSIQKTFGYNAEMSDPAIHYPFQKRSKLNAGDIAAVPMSLSNQFPNDNITQISQLQLNRHEEIRKSYFVLVIFFVTVLNPFYCLDQN